MKKILFLFVLGPSLLFAQEAKKAIEESSKSKIEAFAAGSGSLLKKEYHILGKVKALKIEKMKISDMGMDKSLSGVRFETQVSKTYGSTTKTCFLDSDEIDQFIKANKIIQDINETSEDEIEYQFTSRGGFQAGAYNNKKGWSFFLKLEKYDSDSYVFLERDDFKKIAEIIEAVKF